MKRWLLGALIGLVAVSFTLDADAQRRLGGGKSIGRPSQSLQQRQATPPQAPQAAPQQAPRAQPSTPAQQPGVPAKPASPWKGALMGLAAGLGLAALAHWLGFGDTMATIMMVALLAIAAMALIGFFLRRRAAAAPPPYAYERAGTMAGYPPQPPEATPAPIDRGAPQAAFEAPPQPAVRPGAAMDEFMRGDAGRPSLDQPWGIPAGFDVDGFLANARTYFGKLQDAWNRDDLAQIEEFTTHDMFIALTHELRARGAGAAAEIVTLDAKLLGIESNATDHLASVRFTGTMRTGSETEQFDEVWNLTKPLDGKTGWLLAGIQQLA